MVVRLSGAMASEGRRPDRNRDRYIWILDGRLGELRRHVGYFQPGDLTWCGRWHKNVVVALARYDGRREDFSG